MEPCLENATYCEGWTALIQIPELSQNLTETCKWADILETARRLFVNAGKTIKAAYQTWRKAREAWEYAKRTMINLNLPEEAFNNAVEARENAEQAWTLAQLTWQLALETAEAGKNLCEKYWDGLNYFSDKLTGWLSRCLT